MAGRRAASNRIRGPQSALTDFLASNNISAAQIRVDYQRRQTEAQAQARQDGGVGEEEEEEKEKDEAREETPAQKKKRKRQEQVALTKIKDSKNFKRQKRAKEGEPDEDEDGIAWDMYTKSKPLPGQLENCELCEKRFTVTAYSKTGPHGGLLCTKCSKEQEAETKKDNKKKKPAMARELRRQVQSKLLDGIVQKGAKSLQALCVEKIIDNIQDVEEFGDLPLALMDEMSRLMSRRRILTSKTLDLLLRPDHDKIALYDCGKLEVDDFIKIFSVVPGVQNLDLRSAGQFKDQVIDYIIERDVPLKRLRLEAANLVKDEKWRELFGACGQRLEALTLTWLDYEFSNETFDLLVQRCPNLKRLKMKKCFRLDESALEALCMLNKLEHLSLRLKLPVPTSSITNLITSVGRNLRTLSLEAFYDADDTVLEAIHSDCTHLSKLRFCDNNACTDVGFTSLFTNWLNPPLSSIYLEGCRDLDCTNPDGPDESIGLASAGFQALMTHSGSRLERLDISSNRHITYETLSEVFDGVKQYPYLKEINITSLTRVDTAIVAGIFRSCPAMKKVVAFGCFLIKDVVVPPGVALIGAPDAQYELVQEG